MPSFFTIDNTINQENPNVQFKYDDYNNKIKNYRNDLDIKLRVLDNNRNGVIKNQKKQIDSMVYENILLTVLATSISFYIFMKM
jgi:hypothetical protein